ncbi:MAG: AI-2E family transporter [Carnobacterium sp.]|uniref:AI-2E family transporter n=1 Tax=Carnobacterium sp. TaxID=48221 RepID=UPI0033156A4F
MNDLKEILSQSVKGIKGYFKAALKLSALTFILLCIGFIIIGIDHWGLKALGIAIVDMVPILGSGIIMIPWALIYFFMGNTTMAWQLGLLYIVINVIRQVAEPFVTGREIGVRPLYTFISTIACILLFGPFGAILGALVAIVIKAVYEVKMVRKSYPSE